MLCAACSTQLRPRPQPQPTPTLTATQLETKWDRVSDRTTASDKWAELCEEISSRRGQSGGGGLVKKQRLGESKELELWKMNLVFHHCYPKLDENVSKMQNHLLKR